MTFPGLDASLSASSFNFAIVNESRRSVFCTALAKILTIECSDLASCRKCAYAPFGAKTEIVSLFFTCSSWRSYEHLLMPKSIRAHLTLMNSRYIFIFLREKKDFSFRRGNIGPSNLLLILNAIFSQNTSIFGTFFSKTYVQERFLP